MRSRSPPLEQYILEQHCSPRGLRRGIRKRRLDRGASLTSLLEHKADKYTG